MSKIDYIGALSPNAILAKAQEKIKDIDHVVLYVSTGEGKDSYVTCSRCELRDIAFAMEMIRLTFDKEVRGEL